MKKNLIEKIKESFINLKKDHKIIWIFSIISILFLILFTSFYSYFIQFEWYVPLLASFWTSGIVTFIFTLHSIKISEKQLRTNLRTEELTKESLDISKKSLSFSKQIELNTKKEYLLILKIKPFIEYLEKINFFNEEDESSYFLISNFFDYHIPGIKYFLKKLNDLILQEIPEADEIIEKIKNIELKHDVKKSDPLNLNNIFQKNFSNEINVYERDYIILIILFGSINWVDYEQKSVGLLINFLQIILSYFEFQDKKTINFEENENYINEKKYIKEKIKKVIEKISFFQQTKLIWFLINFQYSNKELEKIYLPNNLILKKIKDNNYDELLLKILEPSWKYSYQPFSFQYFIELIYKENLFWFWDEEVKQWWINKAEKINFEEWKNDFYTKKINKKNNTANIYWKDGSILIENIDYKNFYNIDNESKFAVFYDKKIKQKPRFFDLKNQKEIFKGQLIDIKSNLNSPNLYIVDFYDDNEKHFKRQWFNKNTDKLLSEDSLLFQKDKIVYEIKNNKEYLFLIDEPSIRKEINLKTPRFKNISFSNNFFCITCFDKKENNFFKIEKNEIIFLKKSVFTLEVNFGVYLNNFLENYLSIYEDDKWNLYLFKDDGFFLEKEGIYWFEKIGNNFLIYRTSSENYNLYFVDSKWNNITFEKKYFLGELEENTYSKVSFIINFSVSNEIPIKIWKYYDEKETISKFFLKSIIESKFNGYISKEVYEEIELNYHIQKIEGHDFWFEIRKK